MQIPHYFEIFFMLLLASTLAITGWHLSTDGKETKMPDGSIERTGNIFRAWRFFWMQEHKYKKQYHFDYEHLKKIVPQMRAFLKGSQEGLGDAPRLEFGEIPDTSPSQYWLVANWPVVEKSSFLEDQLGIKINHRPVTGNEFILELYKEEPHYVFPWWLRKMMATCITCHASVYGTLIFAFFHAIFHHSLRTEMYGMLTNNTLYAGIILTWIAYTFSLSYTLTFAYKKL